MTRDHFCGYGPGPRTIFNIEAKRGYSIHDFSFFGLDESEVVFRPGTILKVKKVKKRILNPRCTRQGTGSPIASVVLLDRAAPIACSHGRRNEAEPKGRN